MTFEPLIPAALWVTLAVASAALLAWYALRRPGIVSRLRWGVVVMLMGIGVAVVLGILLNPTWLRELPPPPGKPLLSVLVDSSLSMTTPDSGEGASRFDAAALAAQTIAGDLSNRFEVRVKTFDAASRAADAAMLRAEAPQGRTTDLAAAIAASIDHDRPQGQAIALLSDGIHNGTGGAARVLESVRVANSMSIPIYTRTFGGEISGRDVAVDVQSAQDVAVVKQKVPITVRIKYRGLASAQCEIVLLQDQREIARQQTLLRPGDSSTDISFIVSQEKVGLYSYEVQAIPLPGETSQANNGASYLLRVIDEPIRVLVVEGKPYWDSKFFLRTLALDPAVALDSVVQVAPGRFIRRTLARQEQSAAVGEVALGEAGMLDTEHRRTESFNILTDPAQVLGALDALALYQIIVIGRDAEPFLTDTAIANLQTWISHQGGSLVCYRGAPTSQMNQRLARVLPVRWTPAAESRFRLALTDEGRDLRWMLADGSNDAEVLGQLPTLAASQRISDSKPLAVALAMSVWPHGDDPVPAVVYQPYGSGRAVVIEGSGMWRWAFLPPQHQQLEQVYASLWHSLMHWLTSGSGLLPGQDLSLRTDKVTFATDEPASLTLLVRQGADLKLPQIELAADGSEEVRTFTPSPVGEEAGVFRVNFGPLDEGRYRAYVTNAADDDAAARVVFDVRSFGEEQLNLQARPDLMSRVAEDSGGIVIDADAVRQIDRAFQQHITRSRPATVERTTAWDRWWLLLAVIALWGVSWALRRAGGLV